MKFHEFLSRLYVTSHKPSKSRYVLELFSALCGEKNPASANKSPPYSIKLPGGLRGSDATYRNILYNGESKRYKGLTNPIKLHIRESANCETFKDYLESCVPENAFADLCASFNISNTGERTIAFEVIYNYFREFAYNPTDEVDCTTSELTGKSPTCRNSLLSKRMSDVFEQDILGFNVEMFIESDLTLLTPYLFEDVRQFIGIIKYNQKNVDSPDENTECYQKIILFTDSLLEYVDYLDHNKAIVRAFENESSSSYNKSLDRYIIDARKFTNEPPRCFSEQYLPPKDDCEFGTITNEHRKQLKYQLNEIKSLLAITAKS